ncbi:MAG: DUF5719 family protein [Actinomycetota bacterium]|nr:DUF5719 family protein [Actinomycetota bacterium]
MRWVTLLLALVLAAGTFFVPVLDAPGVETDVGVSPPPIAVCPVEEGSGRNTNLSVLSTVDGPVGLTLFTAGESAGSLASATGASGSLVIPVVDVAAVGTVGGLVEMPNAISAAGSVVQGAASMSAEACASVPEAQAFITGGSTAGEATFELHLMNPYAGEAVVELIVESEAGTESNSRFEAVIVPPRSSTFVDFNDLTPGRESLSVSIETIKGRVNAIGRLGIHGDTGVWRALPGAIDWFIPVPKGSASKELIIATPANTEIDYQVDLFTPSGAEEAFATGRLTERGQHVIDLGEVTEEAIGVRVVSTGPVVPVLRWSSPDIGVAITTGVVVEANRWFLPGASTLEGGWATIIMLNAGIEDSTVSIRPLRENTSVRSFEVSSESVLAIGIEEADGYLVESTNPVVVLWTAQRAGSTSAAIGVPILDG